MFCYIYSMASRHGNWFGEELDSLVFLRFEHVCTRTYDVLLAFKNMSVMVSLLSLGTGVVPGIMVPNILHTLSFLLFHLSICFRYVSLV
jgi:hypothetical protein